MRPAVKLAILASSCELSPTDQKPLTLEPKEEGQRRCCVVSQLSVHAEEPLVEKVLPGEIQSQTEESNFLANMELRLNLSKSRVVAVSHPNQYFLLLKRCKYRHCARPGGAHGTQTVKTSHDDFFLMDQLRGLYGSSSPSKSIRVSCECCLNSCAISCEAAGVPFSVLMVSTIPRKTLRLLL